MPTVLRIKGYRFFFYSNEHLPIHIHIEKDNKTAKFNLEPVELVTSKRFKSSELSKVSKLVQENSEYLIEQWNEFFNNQ